MAIEFQSPLDRFNLHPDDLAFAAEQLGCEVRAINAVSRVEAPHGGFNYDGRPVILFESHAFHTATAGLYDGTHPGISTPSWVHNYGPGGAHQYDRLYEAIALSREAALSSASWGRYQIMGSNYSEAGYDTVEAFVEDMCHSEAYQLDAFVAFLKNTGIDQSLKAKDWRTFAGRYNGLGQIDKYAADIEAAYENG